MSGASLTQGPWRHNSCIPAGAHHTCTDTALNPDSCTHQAAQCRQPASPRGNRQGEAALCAQLEPLQAAACLQQAAQQHACLCPIGGPHVWGGPQREEKLLHVRRCNALHKVAQRAQRLQKLLRTAAVRRVRFADLYRQAVQHGSAVGCCAQAPANERHVPLGCRIPAAWMGHVGRSELSWWATCTSNRVLPSAASSNLQWSARKTCTRRALGTCV